MNVSLCPLLRTPLQLALLLLTTVLLSACDHSDPGQLAPCEPFDGLTPICGFQAPEDLALLPDGSGILVSEYGHMGASEGQLSMLNLDDYQRRELYSSQSSNDLRARNPIWGEATCTEPKTFSPHGIDLAQRASGRWQLLVVNHGSRESVEMFELLKDDAGAWQTLWRGCVEIEDDSLINDVAAIDGGFVTTRMMPRELGFGTYLDYFLGRDTGHLMQWQLERGFSVIKNTGGTIPNGVVVEPDGPRAFINNYGGDTLRVVNRNNGEVLHELDILSADNSVWDPAQPNKLLVASHDASLAKMQGCSSHPHENCPAPFAIVELDTDDYSQRTLFQTEGEYYGAGTAALRVGDKLFIGSFSGGRILVAPIGYGVE